jgi:nucleotide-binding universal stress UspA family protein
MKYDVTFACGHVGEVTLYGPGRDRERKLQWLSTCKCKDCEEADRQARILKETQDRELPDLIGTPKQIDWASSIRINQIQALEKWSDFLAGKVEKAEDRISKYRETADAEKLERALKSLDGRRQDFAECQRAIECLYGIQESRWWIDHRDDSEEALILAYRELGEKEKERVVLEEDRAKMVIMEPEVQKTEAVAIVEAKGGYILMTSEKDEVIRLAVKAAGFTWDSDRRAWAKEITEMTGPAKDLLPDTARKLLEAGARVKAEPWVKETVESGSYEPECHRWICKSTKDASKLFIIKAKGAMLPAGCKTTWDGDGIISPDRWREIREFAEMNGYRITQMAEAMLKAAEDATVKVKVADKETTGNAQDALAAILESSRDVLEDLKEEED